ncbi:MAG: type II secretion system protein M [Alphaproteobacteria bacterium]|nr:type II secretion system protein M [Alphaproteobacteria bacterium]
MALSERFQPVVERVRDQLASMSDRDRKLLLGLIVFGAVTVVAGGIWFMKNSLDGLEQKLAERQQTRQRVVVMLDDYQESATKADEISARIASYAGTDLSTHLEQVADKVGVKERLDSVRQKSASDQGDLVETVYAVTLNELQQDELSGFLFEMETSGYPLKVRSMSVKRRKKSGEYSLNVDLDIATYKVASAAGGDE